MATIIQLRRDETVNWVEADPILADGEPGIEIISGNSLALKIGDGIHSWNNLQYIFSGSVSPGEFNNLGSITEESFNNLVSQGYYLYSLQSGSGEVKGILVVSNNGDILQIRYEFNGIYIRSRTDEGWEEWGDAFVSKLRKHIDNDTIYWDESKQVIKSKGGGAYRLFPYGYL